MFVFQVIGAFWYFFSIERETACWHKACKNQSGCGRSSFSCAHSGNYTFLDDLCPINAPNSTLFNFGIFLEALQSGVVQSSNLPTKFFFCFWWGLRNLRFACARLTIIIYWPGILIFVSLWSYYKMLLWSFLIYLPSRFLRLNLLYPHEFVLCRFLLIVIPVKILRLVCLRHFCSSFGQSLQTSNYPWESCFAILFLSSACCYFYVSLKIWR